MDTPTSHSVSRRAASFRTPPIPVARLPRAVAMPSWRTQHAPAPECVVILLGSLRRGVGATAVPPRARCLHAYGAHGASALCGTSDWHELVPPDEATCPRCRARLGRDATLRLQ